MKRLAPLFIAYYRVSTQRQGRSGLGLEAQEAEVNRVVTASGGQLIAYYKEVETGKRKDRPELLKAIAHAKRSGATLIVAKLDRLSRNAAFLLTLQDSGLPLIFCDLPGANEFTIGVMALVAQQERKRISENTKAALAAYKARGGKLGVHHPKYRMPSPEKRAKAQKAASAANQQRAMEAYSDLLPTMTEWRGFGLSDGQIADRLNKMGHHTRQQRPWNRIQVGRVIRRGAVA